jgi:hypothetical protein
MTEHLAVRADRDRVETALRQLGERPDASVVGPTDDRWCGVAPPGERCAGLAAALSTALGVPVLQVAVADELGVRLYVWGQELVTYASSDAAGPADALRWAGAVERLIDATDARALPEDVSRVLVGAYDDPRARYAELAPALGLPGYLTTREWTG